MLHKPIGAVTAKRDAHHPTVIDLVDPQQEYQDLYPLGRLDRDTSGLLLITDNGPFRLSTAPSSIPCEKGL